MIALYCKVFISKVPVEFSKFGDRFKPLFDFASGVQVSFQRNLRILFEKASLIEYSFRKEHRI
jgi:hypothetical protein